MTALLNLPALALKPRSAYVHIPFCAHKCGYCDFASVAGFDHLADRYLDALEREIVLRLDREPAEVDTIFIGGGTPTRLEPAQIERLLALVSRWFPLSEGGEWTVEANPGTLDEAKVDALVSGGVNRVSLGAQSFQPALLAALERNHAPEAVPRAVDLIRPRFARWSLDLIFGVPGSTPQNWRDDLETALELGPQHLSCYGLVYEKGTRLWKQKHDGRVRPVDEDDEYAMYVHTLDRLEQVGLPPYEISNFSAPGHECRHNLVYWANDPYFGVGLGAARFVDGARAVNTRDLPAYLKRLESGLDPTGPIEKLDTEAHARETAVLMLRRLQSGLSRREFAERTGLELDALVGEVLTRHVRKGWLEDDGDRLRLTRSGLFVADTVMADFL